MTPSRFFALPVTAAFAAFPAAAFAQATAQTPTITGNAWVAYGIIGLFVGTIYVLIMGVLHVERRDAWLGRESRDSGGFFGFVSHDDDDDPGHHGHSN